MFFLAQDFYTMYFLSLGNFLQHCFSSLTMIFVCRSGFKIVVPNGKRGRKQRTYLELQTHYYRPIYLPLVLCLMVYVLLACLVALNPDGVLLVCQQVMRQILSIFPPSKWQLRYQCCINFIALSIIGQFFPSKSLSQLSQSSMSMSSFSQLSSHQNSSLASSLPITSSMSTSSSSVYQSPYGLNSLGELTESYWSFGWWNC